MWIPQSGPSVRGVWMTFAADQSPHVARDPHDAADCDPLSLVERCPATRPIQATQVLRHHTYSTQLRFYALV